MTAAEITLGAVVCALWAVFLILSAIGTVVTHKDAKKKAAELHMVAYATYQLSLHIDRADNSKTRRRIQKMKKTTVQSNINLETLAGGAFAEKLNEALCRWPRTFRTRTQRQPPRDRSRSRSNLHRTKRDSS